MRIQELLMQKRTGLACVLGEIGAAGEAIIVPRLGQ